MLDLPALQSTLCTCFASMAHDRTRGWRALVSHNCGCLDGRFDWEHACPRTTTVHQRRRRADIPVIEQAKIQAQVLVPLVKALQAELGKERANAWSARH